MSRPLYAFMLLFTVICAVGGILTLVPSAGASYPNVFGYKSLCTFAPAATLYCFAAAGVTCTLRASLVKRAAYNGGRPDFRGRALVPLVLVAGLAVASMFWVLDVKNDYTDSTSAATEQAD